MKSGTVYNEELQNTFKMIGLMEVLQRCSSYLSNGKKQFKSIYTMDGSFIKDLDDIPLNAKIVLVSEKPPPKD